jgi:hypothetical protein
MGQAGRYKKEEDVMLGEVRKFKDKKRTRAKGVPNAWYNSKQAK